MRLIRSAVALAAMLAGAAEISAQRVPVARSTTLWFTNLRLVFSADSEGVYLWASQFPRGKTYAAQFNTTEALTWAEDARRFLDGKITSADSGSSRNSAFLKGLEN